MTINPFDLLDNVLEDYASPKTRRLLHALLSLAVALVGVWLAANGDWKQFAIALGALVYTYANKANTDPIPQQPVDSDEHDKWEAQPTHVDDIIPRTTEHDESDLYGDGAELGVSGNQPDLSNFGSAPNIDKPEGGTIMPPNRGWQ